MHLIQAIVLGFIQGLTEFIPVSSSGHLVLAQTFLTGASDHYFLELIDIGTTLALFVYFRKRIWNIIKDVFVNKNYRLARNIIITAIPAGLIGYVMAGFISTNWFFGSAVVVLVALFVVGVVMVVLEKLPKLSPIEDGEKLPWWRALIIGLAQVFALIPGVSRSGSTIITGRLMGMMPAQATEYSFLASLPIMVAVCLKSIVSDRSYIAENAGFLFVSNLVAFIVGLLAIGILLRYLSKHSLAVFGWYRIGLAVVVGAILLMTYHG
jgi:undecaprenyl-diphosphatase